MRQTMKLRRTAKRETVTVEASEDEGTESKLMGISLIGCHWMSP